MFSPWNIYVKKIRDAVGAEDYVNIECDIRTERFLTPAEKTGLLLLLGNKVGKCLL